MKQRKEKKKNGFTLIEIMIVLAIVGLLFSLVGVKVIEKWKGAQKDAAKIQLAAFQQGLQSYYLAHNMFPHTSQGLDALVKKPSAGKVPDNYPDGGHIKKVPKDPWNSDYMYECEDYQNYKLYSAGPDKEAGTSDDIVAE